MRLMPSHLFARILCSGAIVLTACLGPVLADEAPAMSDEPVMESAAPMAEIPAEPAPSKPMVPKFDGSAVWSERTNETTFVSALTALENSVKEGQGSLDAYTFLAKAYYWKGDAFGKDADDRQESWAKGYDYAIMALHTNAYFSREQLRNPARLTSALDLLGKEYVPAMYWAAKNLHDYCRVAYYDDRYDAQPKGYNPWMAKWAKKKGKQYTPKMGKGYYPKHMPTHMDAIAAERFKNLIHRALELDPTYRFGSAAALAATYYAERSYSKGGDIKKAAKLYQDAMNQGKWFENHVLYARNMAVHNRDSVSFKQELEFVLTQSVTEPTGYMPELLLEQTKARRLLQNLDKFFPKVSEEVEMEAKGTQGPNS